MQIKGLSDSEQSAIKKILAPYKTFANFYCYGSRVKGNFSELSDLDLLVDGKLTTNQLRNIRELFEESLELPFIVNLSFKENMTDDFFILIKEDLVEI